MICRELLPQDCGQVDWPISDDRAAVAGDRPAGWILIPQVEHALLASQLLQAWQPPPVFGVRTAQFADPLVAAGHERVSELQDELSWAMIHHDDGWQPWDDAPGLDDNGRPRGFRDMRAEDSNAIWSRSIELAEQRSPLAAWLVARHFLDLVGDDEADLEFREQHAEPCERHLQQWLASPAGQDAGQPLADAASQTLACFDWLSLLLCCGTLAEPRRIDVGQVQVLLQPITGAPFDFQLDPWPLADATRSFAVTGSWVPADRYQSVNQLKQSACPVQLRWTLSSTRNN